jgi:diaminopimelate decarboxylase
MTNKYLLSLADKYESPLYVYDAEKILSQYRKLSDAFAGVPQLKINYAVKALSNVSVLKLFRSLGSGLDTVSVQEVQLGLKAGFDPADIIFTPNGVSLEEIEQAMELGVQINIDNISILEQFGQKHPEVPVCIRMNPHIMAGGNNKISVGHIDSKFGIFTALSKIPECTSMGFICIRVLISTISTPFCAPRRSFSTWQRVSKTWSTSILEVVLRYLTRKGTSARTLRSSERN